MKLSKSSKGIIYTSLALSVLLIINIVFYLSKAPKGEVQNIGMYIALILLAVGSFLFVFISRRIRDNKIKNLEKEYRETYDKITQYIGMSNLTLREKKDIGNDLLDLLMTAQKNNKSVDEVIGAQLEIEKFANNILEAHGANSKTLFYVMTGAQYFLLYIVMAQGFVYIEQRNAGISFFEAESEYSLIGIFALISFGLLPIILSLYKKAALHNKGTMAYIFPIIGISVLFLIGYHIFMEILRRYFSNIAIVNTYINGTNNFISNSIILMAIVVLIFVLFLLKRKINKVI